MIWLAVGTILSAVSAVYTGMQGRESAKAQQAQLDAQAEQTEMQHRADTVAQENALLDTLREQEFALIDAEREAKREEGMFVAQTANSGVRGVTAKRNYRNVLFQRNLDAQAIERAGDRQIRDTSTQGYNRASSIQSTLNNIKAKRSSIKPESYGSIALKSGLAGATTYVGMKGRK